MVFNVIFGSRIVPPLARAAPRTMLRTAVTTPTMAFGKAAPGTLGLAAKNAMMPNSVVARHYGSRSIWNVNSGLFWVFMWFGVGSIVGWVMQEFVGPWYLFEGANKEPFR
eukprot:gnl/MRDRNA2_/MRDRNA2_132913_c0_seq1.p1 gnl/MRDRNA2_/MRDRNA2_132913_c0~~gnl/MRDRNA2_/MRDRNA2_132913_c0_seq1.p1  ORF type:complete len:110 (+),score=20.40 gnl/MRDRNA2_/MRDRNA2_132913_c0_seq1:77-406(+)